MNENPPVCTTSDHDQFAYVMEILKLFRDTDHQEALLWHFNEPGTIKPSSKVTFAVNCSDTFGWGIADGEDILPEDLPLLRKCVEDLTEIWGDKFRIMYLETLYAARKRGQQPMPAWFKHFSATVAADDKDEKSFALIREAGPERTSTYLAP